MKKKIHIQVPEPCHENWNNMTVTEQGKFCLACQKEVIDFSQMSDKEILQHISNASGKSCGRFRNDQLNRALVPPEEIKRIWWKYWLHVAATFLLMTGKSQAQVKAPPPPTTTQPTKDNKEPYNVTVGIIAYPMHTEYTAAGKITDDSNFPLPGVTVRIKGTPIGTSTDMQGNYSLKILSREKVDLVVAAVGMETKEISVVNKNFKLPAVLSNITMHQAATKLMGEVVTFSKKKKPIAAIFKKMKRSDAVVPPSYTMGDTVKPDIVVGKMRAAEETTFAVKGQVVNELGEPVGFASIVVTNLLSGTAADSTGNFELSGLTGNDFITIKVSAVGYEPKMLTIDVLRAAGVLNQKGIMVKEIGVINLEKAGKLDEVVVVSPVSTYKKGLIGTVTICRGVTTKEKVKVLFNEMTGKNDIRILPNPVPLSGTFTIEFNLKNIGEHAVDIVDASGRQIISRQLMINSSRQLETFSANSFHAAGIYFIRVAEKNSKKVYTAKIVVQ